MPSLVSPVGVAIPPFLGNLLVTTLGNGYVSKLFALYKERVPGKADLVCYWFDKASCQIASGNAKRAGLVATNPIRGGASRKALLSAMATSRIFEAWSDEPWINDGAAVRVSLICFSGMDEKALQWKRLDGEPVDEIYFDLTASRHGTGVDLRGVRRLASNRGIASMGDKKGGDFDIPGVLAGDWLRLSANPNGRTNVDILRPWANGMDLTRRPAGKWIVDFGWTMPAGDAALYEERFRWIQDRVYPDRQGNRNEVTCRHWWRHERPRATMWRALAGLSRCVVTARVAKHRLFGWSDTRVCPDSQLIVIARDDDTTFGILHSRLHEIWSLRLGTSLEDRPRYTPTTTFETVPFPEGSDAGRACRRLR